MVAFAHEGPLLHPQYVVGPHDCCSTKSHCGKKGKPAPRNGTKFCLSKKLLAFAMLDDPADISMSSVHTE